MLRLGQYFKFEQSMFLVGYYCGLMIIREGTMYLGVTFAQEYILEHERIYRQLIWLTMNIDPHQKK